MVGQALEGVRRRIEEAARRAGRDPAEVRLVYVTKGVSVPRIEEALAAGATDLGENRVQEALAKQTALVAGGHVGGVRWHLIGHLQRNKAKIAVERFDVIHSVDSLELIQALDRLASLRQAQGEWRERALELLVQVNVSGEQTKHGCRPEEARGLAEAILRSKGLRWAGLMTMAPFSDDPESSRPVFRRLRELRDGLRHPSLAGPGAELHLSMGMSQDFEVAVEEGATMVRIGTAIFGERK